MILADIAAVKASAVLTEDGKRARIADIKGEAIKAASPAEPIVIEFTAGKAPIVVTLKSVKHWPGGVEIDMDVSRDGKAVPYSKPWRIINPPVLVEAEDGDIVQPIMRRDFKTGEVTQVGERRFKEAPLLALRQMARDFVEDLLRSAK